MALTPEVRAELLALEARMEAALDSMVRCECGRNWRAGEGAPRSCWECAEEAKVDDGYRGDLAWSEGSGYADDRPYSRVEILLGSVAHGDPESGPSPHDVGWTRAELDEALGGIGEPPCTDLEWAASASYFNGVRFRQDATLAEEWAARLAAAQAAIDDGYGRHSG